MLENLSKLSLAQFYPSHHSFKACLLFWVWPFLTTVNATANPKAANDVLIAENSYLEDLFDNIEWICMSSATYFILFFNRGQARTQKYGFFQSHLLLFLQELQALTRDQPGTRFLFQQQGIKDRDNPLIKAGLKHRFQIVCQLKE